MKKQLVKGNTFEKRYTFLEHLLKKCFGPSCFVRALIESILTFRWATFKLTEWIRTFHERSSLLCTIYLGCTNSEI